MPFVVFAEAPTLFGKACANDPCKLSDVLPMIKYMIDYIAHTVLVPVSIIALAYAGITMIMSSGNSGEVNKANTMITNTIYGIIIVFAAYFIVALIVNGLTGKTGTVDEAVQDYTTRAK